MKKIVANVMHPGGSNTIECDNLVLVGFVGRDRAWSAFSYQLWQPVTDRKMLLYAAKAILGQLADEEDAYGLAAMRALEEIHQKKRGE